MKKQKLTALAEKALRAIAEDKNPRSIVADGIMQAGGFVQHATAEDHEWDDWVVTLFAEDAFGLSTDDAYEEKAERVADNLSAYRRSAVEHEW